MALFSPRVEPASEHERDGNRHSRRADDRGLISPTWREQISEKTEDGAGSRQPDFEVEHERVLSAARLLETGYEIGLQISLRLTCHAQPPFEHCVKRYAPPLLEFKWSILLHPRQTNAAVL